MFRNIVQMYIVLYYGCCMVIGEWVYHNGLRQHLVECIFTVDCKLVDQLLMQNAQP